MVFIIVVSLYFLDKPDEYRVLPVPAFIETQDQCDKMLRSMESGLEPIRLKSGAMKYSAFCFGRESKGE